MNMFSAFLAAISPGEAVVTSKVVDRKFGGETTSLVVKINKPPQEAYTSLDGGPDPFGKQWKLPQDNRSSETLKNLEGRYKAVQAAPLPDDLKAHITAATDAVTSLAAHEHVPGDLH